MKQKNVKHILDEMVNNDIIDSYVLTKSYVVYKYSKEADKYLSDHNYSTNGEILCHKGKAELKITYIY